MTTPEPTGRRSSTALMAPIPDEYTKARPPSSAPSTSSSALQFGFPSRPEIRSPPGWKVEVRVTGRFVGAPGCFVPLPAVTATVEGCNSWGTDGSSARCERLVQHVRSDGTAEQCEATKGCDPVSVATGLTGCHSP